LDRTGTNLPAVGEYNQTVVLDAIRRRPEGITRSEIAALTALSQMTVTNACRRLLDGPPVRTASVLRGGVRQAVA
jgi:predicted transcriptional regulator